MYCGEVLTGGEKSLAEGTRKPIGARLPGPPSRECLILLAKLGGLEPVAHFRGPRVMVSALRCPLTLETEAGGRGSPACTNWPPWDSRPPNPFTARTTQGCTLSGPHVNRPEIAQDALVAPPLAGRPLRPKPLSDRL
jgi:hypothetical protein